MLTAAGLLLVIGCSPLSDKKNNSEESVRDRLFWLDKTAALLRYGDGLAASESEADFLRFSESEIVDRLMADPRFLETVLDFNLFFLGQKLPTLLVEIPSGEEGATVKTYRQNIFDFPQAIASAQSFATGKGEFLDLLKYEQEFFVGPTVRPTWKNTYGIFEPIKNADKLSDDELRGKYYRVVTGALDKLDAKIALKDKDASCELARNLIFVNHFVTPLALAGISTTAYFTSFFINYSHLTIACGDDYSLADVKDAAVGLRRIMNAIFSQARKNSFPDYTPARVNEIRSWQNAEFEKDGYNNSFRVSEFWDKNQNSRTNFNRKRAAAVLKTYFCDDLTPVDLVFDDEKDDHVQGKHASEPSCQACHYKLDPMAGFFRYRGYRGRYQKTEPIRTFDAGDTLRGEEVADYDNLWRAPNGVWNVGFVRSPNDKSLNEYETNHEYPLQGLMEIIRNAPEAKLCITKRLAEYVFGKDQLVHSQWIADMADEFASEENSNIAFKTVLKEMLLSQTFRQQNPLSDVCYDQPGSALQNVPCKISGLYQNYCHQCHTTEFDFGSVEDRSLMRERLETTDRLRRMPLNMHMPDVDRVKFLKWLKEAE